jgi:regulatory protein
MALNYVGRFATSRSKLIAYLRRKLRERGWNEARKADIEGLADKMVRLGYVDDRAYALAKARSLSSRGYGGRRVNQALHHAGIGDDEADEARNLCEEEAVAAALRFASRRSIGPYGNCKPGPPEQERALAQMVRAGHSFSLAKAIIALEPGEIPDSESLFNVR